MSTLLEELEATRKENTRLKIEAESRAHNERVRMSSLGGQATAEKRRQSGDNPFERNRDLALQRSIDTRKNYPLPIPAQQKSSEFKSFAHKIRSKTRDGWELIEAVYEVFTRARDAQADGLILESATWLADRGFGKPVQVGQLLDGEGNPVAFTLWSPATNQPVGDVITLKDGKVIDESQEVYEPPATAMEEPKSYEPQPRDGFSYGIARPWGPGEPEPKRGE